MPPSTEGLGFLGCACRQSTAYRITRLWCQRRPAPDEGFEWRQSRPREAALLGDGGRPDGYGIILFRRSLQGRPGCFFAMVVTVVAMLNEYYGMLMGEYEVAHWRR